MDGHCFVFLRPLPFQQAPASLLPAASLPASGLDCTNVNDQRVISNQMIESMDTEIGRVLVEAGIATITDGVLEFTPERQYHDRAARRQRHVRAGGEGARSIPSAPRARCTRPAYGHR